MKSNTHKPKAPESKRGLKSNAKRMKMKNQSHQYSQTALEAKLLQPYNHNNVMKSAWSAWASLGRNLMLNMADHGLCDGKL